MTDNNTEAYWTANGLSLHTKAWTVTSYGGKKYWSSGKRGDDLQMPFLVGRSHQPKTRDSQVLSLDITVVPLNPDGSRDLARTVEQKVDQNWKTIVAAVDVDGQFDLVKRWYDPDTTALMSATARAELVDGQGPNRVGRDYSGQLQLVLADPYFYGDPITENMGTSIFVAGEVETDHVTLSMSAGRFTGPDGNWIEYSGSSSVQIDSRARSAMSGSKYVNGQITRNPNFAKWPTLRPGEGATTGSGLIIYHPAYR